MPPPPPTNQDWVIDPRSPGDEKDKYKYKEKYVEVGSFDLYLMPSLFTCSMFKGKYDNEPCCPEGMIESLYKRLIILSIDCHYIPPFILTTFTLKHLKFNALNHTTQAGIYTGTPTGVG